jgi:opacity protein-like surface antigen
MLLAPLLVAAPLSAVKAADLGPPPEPMAVPAPAPATACCAGGLYLKGFLGFSNQQADDFHNDLIRDGDFEIVSHEFDSAPFAGLGVGYRHSKKFRFDLTGEFRGRSKFRGLDFNRDENTTNEYNGFKSEWLFLANGYWDITTFKGMTPYVGAGVGIVNVGLDDFQDINQINGGLHWAEDGNEWNFAWALHAGMAYDISDALTLDMGYRYVNMGDGKTGTFTTFDSTDSPGPITVEDIDSHDIMVGLRWNWGHGGCCETAAYVPEETYEPVYEPYK